MLSTSAAISAGNEECKGDAKHLLATMTLPSGMWRFDSLKKAMVYLYAQSFDDMLLTDSNTCLHEDTFLKQFSKLHLVEDLLRIGDFFVMDQLNRVTPIYDTLRLSRLHFLPSV